MALGAFILFVHSAWAQDARRCSPKQNLQAEREAGRLRSWDDLYQSFKRYGGCDDVDAAEGYSESVARILVDKWGTLPWLSELVAKDKAFRRFVLGGVNATLDMKDVKAIKQNSISACPPGLHALCEGLSKQADAAFSENEYYQQKK
jgi:hypothetical protein